MFLQLPPRSEVLRSFPEFFSTEFFSYGVLASESCLSRVTITGQGLVHLLWSQPLMPTLSSSQVSGIELGSLDLEAAVFTHSAI